jgi:hypothetical protein
MCYFTAVLRIRTRIRIHRIHMFLGLPDPPPAKKHRTPFWVRSLRPSASVVIHIRSPTGATEGPHRSQKNGSAQQVTLTEKVSEWLGAATGAPVMKARTGGLKQRVWNDYKGPGFLAVI